MTLHLPGPLWLVGCGSMGSAMLDGWLAAGADPAQVTVIRPSGRSVGQDIRVLTDYPEDEVPAIVVLAMKPQQLDAVAPALAHILDPATLLVSVLAGVELATLRARFPAPRAIVRAMPNLASALRKGATVMFSDAVEARAGAGALMSALGHVEWFEEESLFQLGGVLVGAAPAFLFRFVDGLAEAAARLGMPADQAAQLAVRMAEGAAALAASPGESPAVLARRVASPGGTTEAGLAVLDADRALSVLLEQTLAASRRRSEELAVAAKPEGAG